MVRNAGGRAFDAIRTLSVLQTIGAPGTIVVMHHTDCGVTHFHDADVKKALLEIAPAEEEAIQAMKFGEITNGPEQSVKEDVRLIRASPLIRKSTRIVGLVYDIKTGLLSEVIDADN